MSLAKPHQDEPVDTVTGEDDDWVYGETRLSISGRFITTWMKLKRFPVVDGSSPEHQRYLSEAECRRFHKARAYWAELGRDLGRCAYCEATC